MVKWSPMLIYAAIKICLYKLFCAWRHPKPIEWYEARVLCVGLDGAGKTSVLARAADHTRFDAVVDPTTGFNVRTLSVPPDWKLSVWDIGGAATVRPYWHKYVTFDTRAVIWVLDSSDRSRLEEASSALRGVLDGEMRLRGTPLLVLLNKCEIDGLPAAEAREVLRLDQLGCGSVRAHQVQPCSAATGHGIPEAFKWLSETLTATLR